MSNTYIIIEFSDKENALDIMNVLMTHTTARITITKDIQEYALEREQLKRKKSNNLTEALSDTSEPPAKRSTKKSSEPSLPSGLLVPKEEINDDNDPDYEEEPSAEQKILLNVFKNLQSTEFDKLAQNSSEDDTTRRKPGRPPNGERSSNRSGQTYTPLTCALCGAVIKACGMDLHKRGNHAIIHTDLQRYICPVPTCGQKTRHRSNMVSHAKQAHGLTGTISVQDCLRPHEEEELRQMVVRCFPEMDGIDVKRRGRRANKFVYDGGVSVMETTNDEEEEEEYGGAKTLEDVMRGIV